MSIDYQHSIKIVYIYNSDKILIEPCLVDTRLHLLELINQEKLFL